MKDLILLAAVLCVFGGGFAVMTWLDVFLARVRRDSPPAPEPPYAPSCVLLRSPVEEETLLEEVRRFRAGHPQMQILLCDPTDPDGLPESAFFPPQEGQGR